MERASSSRDEPDLCVDQSHHTDQWTGGVRFELPSCCSYLGPSLPYNYLLSSNDLCSDAVLPPTRLAKLSNKSNQGGLQLLDGPAQLQHPPVPETQKSQEKIDDVMRYNGRTKANEGKAQRNVHWPICDSDQQTR